MTSLEIAPVNILRNSKVLGLVVDQNTVQKKPLSGWRAAVFLVARPTELGTDRKSECRTLYRKTLLLYWGKLDPIKQECLLWSDELRFYGFFTKENVGAISDRPVTAFLIQC
jgi:hypothetical protein